MDDDEPLGKDPEPEQCRTWTCGPVLKHHSPYLQLTNLMPRPNNANFVPGKLPLPQYGIIFEPHTDRGIVLFRSESLPEVTRRFDRLVTIMDVLYHPTRWQKSLPKIRTLLRKLINTMNQHPNWIEVHIAAYHGLVEFFKKRTFTSDEISVQYSPDYFTPLHLAVLQQWSNVVERILAHQPHCDRVDHEKNTVIHLGTLGPVSIFKLLLQKVPNVRSLMRQVNGRNLTAVGVACINDKKVHLQQMMKFGLTPRMLTLVNDRDFLSQLDDVTVLLFTESDLDQLNFNRISTGGCPLHWCVDSVGIRRLIGDFNPHTLNWNGDTPLMVMVKDNHFSAAVCLMVYDCDVNRPDSRGDRPLHVAVQINQVMLAKALIIFDANVKALNASGHDAYTLAKNLHPSYGKEMVQVFETYQAKLKLSEKTFEPKPNMATETTDGDDYMEGLLGAELLHFRYDVDEVCARQQQAWRRSTAAEQQQQQQPPKAISNILNLDGGGIRGLFTVQMMIEMQRYLKRDLISYFDWIAGTSTGSMIAFSICKGTSLSEIRRLYFIFKDEILQGSKPYSTERLERLFKYYLKAEVPINEIWEQDRKHLIITAVRVDRHPPTLHLFCSHNYSRQKEHSNIPIWHALRASCAAPTYFRHFSPFIDGGLIANNPTMDAMTEFFRYQTALKKNPTLTKPDTAATAALLQPSRLGLVLSIGTGQARLPVENMAPIFDKFNYFMDFRSCVRDLSWTMGIEVASQMKLQVTNCNNHIVTRAAAWCSCLDVPYFRFNPTFPKKIPLDESNDEELVSGLWEVKLYCLQITHYFKKLAQILDNQNTRPATMKNQLEK